ncbi:MAG: EAL domain-containing protein [Actinomycetota bacterium]
MADSSARSLVESFFAAASDLFVAFDGEASVVLTNEAARRSFGVAEGRVHAREVTKLVHPDDRGLAVRSVVAAYDGDGPADPVRIRHRHDDGTSFTVEWRFERLDDADVVVAVGRDVTEAVRHEGQLFFARRIIDTASDLVFVYRRGGEIEWCNPAALAAHGYRPDELIGQNAVGFLHPEDRREVMRRLDRLRPDEEVAVRARSRRHDGSWLTLDMKIRLDPTQDRYLAIQRDVTETVLTERRLQRTRRFFDAAAELFVVVDGEGIVRDLNLAATRRLEGTDRSAFVGHSIGSLWGGDLEDRIIGLPLGAWRRFERAERHEDGPPRLLAWEAHRLSDDEVHLMARDVTEERRLTDELSHQATTDELTGLANRTAMSTHLEAVLDAGHDVALLLLDLDQFKLINDSMGHEAGDELLVGVAERLRKSVAIGDLVARLGGDEFVVVSTGAGLDEAEALARRICRSFVEPIEVTGRELRVSASIGVAAGSEVSHRTADLLREADTAAYQAKELGRNRYELFNDHMREQARERIAVEHGIRSGLTVDEFVLHYQAVNDLRTGAVRGFEALARWEHPIDGLQPPARFIEIAESSGLIVELGAHVLDLALAQLVEWHHLRQTLTMAVNVSPVQLAHPEFPATVQAAIARHGVDPMRVVLELTETALIHNVEHAATVMHRLRSLGVRLAIDDFGTGYSALGYLRDLPIDIVKIDRGFGADVDRNESTSAIVRAAITLGHSLGTSVVAEGVETQEVAAHLAELGCDLAQGFLFHRPSPAADAAALLVDDPTPSRTSASAR